ncbi:MAG: glutamate mutase L [Chloroflexi bacterium]|nr:glutamate mutase L [Chloroflexota bacterium]
MPDNSVLAVDFGNVHTRAVLIDLVEGVFQVVASAEERTTAGFPVDDVGVGLRRAVEKLTAMTGRQFLTRDGRVITPEAVDRTGVDVFLATASVGRPLRTVVIGLYPEMSVASVLRAAAGTYITVAEVISVADGRSNEERLNALALANPDLIVIAGGTEDGARDPILEMARLTRLAIRLQRRSLPPTVLFAGNSAIRDQIRAIFENVALVIYAENVRPSLRVEQVEDARAQLAVAFDKFSEHRGMGFDQVSYQARLGVLPTAQSYDSVVRYLGAVSGRRRGGILAVDLGSAASTLSASVGGVVSTSIRTDIGLGHSAGTTLEAAGIERMRVWLPFAADDDEIAGYALNKTLRPASIPQTHRTLFLEHALLRAAMHTLLTTARPLWTPDIAFDDLRAPMPPLDRIIGAGAALTDTGRPGMAAMLLLDAIQPVGVARLQVDSSALVPALGALSRINPTAVVQVLDSGGLEDLGMAFCVSGRPRRGRMAVRVTVRKEGGETEKFTVEGGHLFRYPLQIGVTATVSVRVARGLNIGGRRGFKMTLTGGTAGLIIDARGRPLPLENALKNRAEQIVGWYADATGDEAMSIPEDWLTIRKVEPNVESVTSRDGRPDARSAGRIDSVLPDQDEDDFRAPLPPKPAAPAPRGRGRRGKSAEPAAVNKAGAGAPNQTPEDDLDDLRTLFP